MKYCKKCVQTDTRPNIIFDDNQICYACKWEDEKAKINWMDREKELRQIAQDAKIEAKSRKSPYDCVVGVSGGKDSTFQAIYAKEKLGLNILLVNGAADEITELGRKNLDNLCRQGFDLISIKPNPNIAKRLARNAFFEKCNIVAPSEYALWSSAYIIADKFDIPLIIQGENAALTLGVASGQDRNGDAFGTVNQNTLKGCKAGNLISEGITEEDLYFYNFPSVEGLIERGTKAIWLQYYTNEWSQVGNAEFAIARGLVGREDDSLEDLGRYRRYSCLDCDIAIANQMIKYLKFGFGQANDEACYDIREGRISREEAIELLKKYDGKCGQKYIDIFCNYIDITEEQFWQVVDKFVNKNLFKKDEKGKWIPKFNVGEDYNEG